MNRYALILSALFAVACDSDKAPEMSTAGDDQVATKADARRAGKSDRGVDFCEAFEWYGDGECDDFCPNPDPDCQAPEETCASDADCAGGYCAQFASCLAIGCPPPPPPQCVFPNCDQGVALCEIVPPSADSCPEGQTIAARNGCYECVDARTCEPAADPNECYENADCGPGARCISAECSLQGSCPANFCEPDENDPNECYEDADCDSGSCLIAQCDPRGNCPDNRCAPAEPADECFEDSECPGAQVCLIAQCNPNGPCPANECVDRVCGGLAGFRCGEGEYCAFDAEAGCGFADATGVCQERADFCPAVVDPVCGCDGNTYNNGCEAARAGVSVATDGACEEEPVRACGTRGGVMCGDDEYCNFGGDHCGRADQGGACETIPDLCTREVAPVCGCDGNTYSNRCNAAARGVSVEHEGTCERE